MNPDKFLRGQKDCRANLEPQSPDLDYLRGWRTAHDEELMMREYEGESDDG